MSKPAEKEISEAEAFEQYNVLLEKIRAEYKPRLKSLSKNDLIKMVVELSTHIALLKEFSAQESTNE